MTPGWLPKRARKEKEGNTGPEDAVSLLEGGLGYEVSLCTRLTRHDTGRPYSSIPTVVAAPFELSQEHYVVGA